ncbi:MAG: hypothetical protein PHH26_02490 [Candidatus Thermoplasmatota archaeon]|nr:hypothetical protein [Candidatus Thermoplasmatota archaeon]
MGEKVMNKLIVAFVCVCATLLAACNGVVDSSNETATDPAATVPSPGGPVTYPTNTVISTPPPCTRGLVLDSDGPSAGTVSAGTKSASLGDSLVKISTCGDEEVESMTMTVASKDGGSPLGNLKNLKIMMGQTTVAGPMEIKSLNADGTATVVFIDAFTLKANSTYQLTAVADVAAEEAAPGTLFNKSFEVTLSSLTLKNESTLILYKGSSYTVTVTQ